MPKKTGIVFVIVGAVLILSALLLFFHNDTEDDHAAAASQAALEEVRSVISAQTEVPVLHTGTFEIEQVWVEEEPAELPAVEIDGYDYVGYLSVPALELELPVMSELDDTRLKLAPCRQLGSPRTGDLVIAGHNYTSHFARLYTLRSGDPVQFTDMDGQVYSYVIDKLETLKPTDSDAVLDSGYDLVLYTCTYGSEARTVVFCSLNS